MRIHYGVTGEERKQLVKVIANTIGARAVYKGMPTAAYEVDYFTVTKDGTLEFSDRSDIEEVTTVLEALTVAGFACAGETVEEGVPVDEASRTPAEASVGQQEARESGENSSVDLTVNIPIERHSGISLRNLINLVYTRAGLLNKALGTALRVEDGLIEAMRDDTSVLTIDRFFSTLAAYEDRHGKAMDGLCIGRKEISFSTLPATEDTDILRTFTILCAMMNKQAVTQQRIKARFLTEENEKYAMRIWLMRMGMNGPEYKTERKILTEKLFGHCAFHTELDRERWQQKQNEKRDAIKALKRIDTNMKVTVDEGDT